MKLSMNDFSVLKRRFEIEKVKDLLRYRQWSKITTFENKRINEQYFKICTEWMHEVRFNYKLSHEAYILSIKIFCEYLYRKYSMLKNLQLVAIISCLISRGFEDDDCSPYFTSTEAAYFTDYTYTSKVVNNSTFILSRSLDYKFNSPTTAHMIYSLCIKFVPHLDSFRLSLIISEIFHTSIVCMSYSIFTTAVSCCLVSSAMFFDTKISYISILKLVNQECLELDDDMSNIYSCINDIIQKILKIDEIKIKRIFCPPRAVEIIKRRIKFIQC